MAPWRNGKRTSLLNYEVRVQLPGGPLILVKLHPIVKYHYQEVDRSQKCVKPMNASETVVHEGLKSIFIIC